MSGPLLAEQYVLLAVVIAVTTVVLARLIIADRARKRAEQAKAAREWRTAHPDAAKEIQ